MTRKHYEALAAALASTRPKPSERKDNQWERDTIAIADALQAIAPKFNRKMFLQATDK